MANGKAKDIEGYQAEILKIGGPVLIPHIHKLFNQAIKQGFLKPWTRSLIIPIFKSGDTNNPSNYRTIMISPLLAKLYGIILERKLSIWLESEGKRAKGQEDFRKQHSTTNHLVTLRIIVEECRDDKSNLFCCFLDFRKASDTIPRNNLWNRLEELKVSFELRVAAIRLYENVISKLKSNKWWSKDIKCNIGVKQGFPLSPTLLGIYIDNLEGCLEEAGCASTVLAEIVIILLLYADDIVLLARCPSDLAKQLILLKDFSSTMGMIVNIDKTKVMIIKSKKDTYANFMYDNSNLEEVSSYKYLGIYIHHNLNWNYSIEKRINVGDEDRTSNF